MSTLNLEEENTQELLRPQNIRWNARACTATAKRTSTDAFRATAICVY